MTDTLPPGVTFESASAGCTYLDGVTVICNEALMAADTSITYTITVRVEGDVPVSTSLENLAVVGFDGLDPDPSDNMDTADTSIIILYRYIYLPIVFKNDTAGLPDLVGSFTLTPDKPHFNAGEHVLIEACITNQGMAPADPFWVDFYINPDPIPTRTNILWQDTCALVPCYGIAWPFPAGLLPSQTICMESIPGDYDGNQTFWPGSFAAGTTDLYLYVDSWNPNDVTDEVGAALESDESNNGYELHGLIVTDPFLDEAPTPVAPEFPSRPAAGEDR